VNAILRKITPTSEKKPLEQASTALEAADLAGATAHPLWMVDRWEREFGEENVRKICAHDQRAPEISVRVASPDTEKELRREGVELVPGRILTSARTAVSGNITHTSAFRQGRVVVQDEASQLIALLVGCGTNILDCCSAPGGKTRIVARRNPQARILAVELHPHRARTMRRLIPEKNVEVVAGDVTAFAAVERFDHILADVPCSGTGTLSRNPEIKWKLKPSDLADLHRKQTAILEAAMKVLLPGGKLIYSTCSLEREENEDVIEEVVRLNPNLRIVDCDSELQKLRQEGETAWPDLHSLTGGRFLRTIPGVHPCDGFFAAILQKD
jgi:16S rRNA (cytosine967-C5)-methyltransferase